MKLEHCLRSSAGLFERIHAREALPVEGTLSGERLRGNFRGVNHPHRRSDKAMLPDVLLGTLFETEDERYRWLNSAFCVLEGKIKAAALRMEARVFACVSDLV